MDHTIREAAVALFHETGAEFTLNDLSERTGLPRATLYRRIGSKDQLLRQLADDNLIRLDDGRGMDSRIIAAARTVVAQYGFLACTMDQIAREAGIGIATLYRRFKDKETLLDHLRTHMAPKPVVRQASESSEPDIEIDLKKLIDVGLRFAEQNRDVAQILYSARPAEQDFVEPFRRDVAEGFSRLVSYMQAQQQSDRLRKDVSAEDLAMTLNGLITHYSVHGPAYLARPLDVERDGETILKLFLQCAQGSPER